MTLETGWSERDASRRDGGCRTRVKICGITRPQDLDAAVETGADAVGVVCDVPIDTPREVSVERAAALVDRTPPFVTAVLVTMATDPDRVSKLAERVEPDAVQLHGGVSAGDLSYLRSLVSARLFVAVDATDEGIADHYDELADVLVVDSVDESGAGGTGETHDWAATRRRRDALDSPIVLAGGLTPENVEAAIRAVRPFAVDVSTGVEATGGRKDYEAVETFVSRARGERATSAER